MAAGRGIGEPVPSDRLRDSVCQMFPAASGLCVSVPRLIPCGCPKTQTRDEAAVATAIRKRKHRSRALSSYVDHGGREVQQFIQRVRENILPLSVAKSLPEAFQEWRFTETTHDHEQPTETCELCEQEQLRYQFEIVNEHNQNTMLVGSTCILRFQVAVYDEGRKLSEAEARTKLSRLTEKMRQDSCIEQLQRVSDAEARDGSGKGDILPNALAYYRKNGKLTPKYAFVVLWRLQKHKIDHNPSFFKVSLANDKHKDDLGAMQASRAHLIWPALTSQQRKIAERLGHKPPPPDRV